MIHYGTVRQDGVTVSCVWGNIHKQRRFNPWVPESRLSPNSRQRAHRNSTTLENELLHQPGIDENAYYGAMARFLRPPFVGAIFLHPILSYLFLASLLLRFMALVSLRCRP